MHWKHYINSVNLKVAVLAACHWSCSNLVVIALITTSQVPLDYYFLGHILQLREVGVLV